MPQPQRLQRRQVGGSEPLPKFPKANVEISVKSYFGLEILFFSDINSKHFAEGISAVMVGHDSAEMVGTLGSDMDWSSSLCEDLFGARTIGPWQRQGLVTRLGQVRCRLWDWVIRKPDQSQARLLGSL